MSPPSSLTRSEMYVGLTLVVGIALWLYMPAIAQQQAYHRFADTRAWRGIPNAADVLSNLAFLAVGLLGFYRVQQGQRPLPQVVRIGLNVFFLGLFLTGFGSAYYHWNPTDQTLVGDRLPMTVAFAGVFGAMLAERVSAQCGLAVLLLMLVVGPASVFYWQSTGDLSLYVVVQFGGMAGMLLLLSLTEAGHDPFPWWALMAWYAVSKVMESGDPLIWTASREWFAGHAWKHLAAAMGGLAIANALLRRAPKVRSGDK